MHSSHVIKTVNSINCVEMNEQTNKEIKLNTSQI